MTPTNNGKNEITNRIFLKHKAMNSDSLRSLSLTKQRKDQLPTIKNLRKDNIHLVKRVFSNENLYERNAISSLNKKVSLIKKTISESSDKKLIFNKLYKDITNDV